MSERIWEYLQAGTVLLGDFAVCCLLVGMAPLVGGFSLGYAPWSWLLMLAVQLFLGLTILYRGTTWTIYLIVQGLAVAVEMFLAAFMITTTEYVADLRMWFVSAAAVIGMHAAYVAYRRPSANLILGYFDATILVLFSYLYVEYSTGRTEPALWALASAAAVYDLIVVSHLRTESENGHRISGASALGKGILIALPALFLIVTGIAIGSASGQIHSLVDAIVWVLGKIWMAIAFVIEIFVAGLSYIILFFYRFLPNGQAYEQEAAMPDMAGEAGIMEETESVLPPWLIPLVGGIVLIGFVVWGLYELRNIHIRLRPASVKKRKVVKKSFFLSSLTDLMRRAADQLIFLWTSFRYRKTPQGLYVLAERRGSRLKVKKRRSESPGAYLRRLNEKIAADAGISSKACPALLDLAGMLDDIYYGGKSIQLTPGEYADIRNLLLDVKRLNEYTDIS